MARKDRQDKQKKKRDGMGQLLYVLYVLTLAAAVWVTVSLFRIQWGFEPDPAIARELKAKVKRNIEEPKRGSILSEDGRLLALSFPEYDIALDCKVAGDTLWDNNVDALARGLSEILRDKSAAEYSRYLKNGRKAGKRDLQITKKADIKTKDKLLALPILEKGRYQGGRIVTSKNRRHYPYGDLGFRTIGFVRDGDIRTGNDFIGLDGAFDYELHGTDGVYWTTKSDFGDIESRDSASFSAVDGNDIRTTLNIDYQSIADKALRSQIGGDELVEGGCVVLMDVKTGAIRSMVNLVRDKKNPAVLKESYNLVVKRLGEPGSVFKSTCLMIMLENGHVKSLDQTIPTNHGVLAGYPYSADKHITDYERKTGRMRIPIIEGFKVSSNYMFQYLAVENYEKHPERYVESLYPFKFSEPFDFDLKGMEYRQFRTPKDPHWSKTDLTSLATGYGVDVSPLHIITFYNAIANDGKMMKPYLVEDIEKDGIVIRKRGPSVLNASICSKATADTLTRALCSVVEEGTATRLRDARCTVAGKTGTSRVALESGGYFTKDGCKKNQGTFVGFFPAEDPQYSIICVVYSVLSHKDYYGGTIPATVVKEIVDNIYTIDPYWRKAVGEEEVTE